ncbi:hypothetical protein DS799_24370 [Salmonella enterica]|uniref:Uncharacterized protein n=1 Tax=Salmonella enterica subsp. enterica serovar Mbandaka TaxID=192954 RepID=A0A608DJL6_SALET|nr:hypothetical protein [Salmonella enterica]EBH9212912.1 hypothetical protein [Salmonella enterica subsp. enterica serovar Mbandaka]EBN9256124.1 hypothetical protein [Salmonella enterica subsp. enterica]EAA7970431.1 hypothetical protein [Salmonella enterica]EAN3549624.1 hypothetical protein [Salmonella enterica]
MFFPENNLKLHLKRMVARYIYLIWILFLKTNFLMLPKSLMISFFYFEEKNQERNAEIQDYLISTLHHLIAF